MAFTGDLKLYFGDFGKEYGRYAITLEPIGWLNAETGVNVTIEAGYLCDGATTPRWLWWFLPPWGDISTRAAILHDYICGLLDEGRPVAGCETRANCDREFHHALLALGVSAWRAAIAYAGVRANSITEGRG